MVLGINVVWAQAVTMDQCHGDDAVTVATTRMIKQLKAKNYDAAGFWSAVADKLMEIQKIKMNIIPIELDENERPVGLRPLTDDPDPPLPPLSSANEN